MTTAAIREDDQPYDIGTSGHLSVGGKATAAVSTVTEGDAAHLSLDLSRRLRVVPDWGAGTVTTGGAIPTTGQAVYPLASAQDTAILVPLATLAASGAWTLSTVVNVQGYHRINVDIYYTADGSGGAGGFLGYWPKVSNKSGAAPAANDDVWTTPTIVNDTRTATVPSGTIATGEDSTFSPGFAYSVTERVLVRSLAMANDTDQVRERTVFNIEGARWFCVEYAEVGDPSNPGNCAIEVSVFV